MGAQWLGASETGKQRTNAPPWYCSRSHHQQDVSTCVGRLLQMTESSWSARLAAGLYFQTENSLLDHSSEGPRYHGRHCLRVDTSYRLELNGFWSSDNRLGECFVAAANQSTRQKYFSDKTSLGNGLASMYQKTQRLLTFLRAAITLSGHSRWSFAAELGSRTFLCISRSADKAEAACLVS